MDIEPQSTLRTKRLILRPFRSSDLDDLHKVLSDAYAMRFWNDPHQDLSETRAFIEGTINASAQETCDFIIEYDGRAIGKMGLWKCPEIGYFIAPEYQGQGLANEAMSAVLPYLFARFPSMDAIIADVDPDNAASLALLRRHGFQKTHTARATIKIGGRWCDSVYLKRTRDYPSPETMA